MPRPARQKPNRETRRNPSPHTSKGSQLATVRIYKVAELLGTTSQEVTALLKRDHGIEVKSASSTIEEVVGRQFVDRLERQRGLYLSRGAMVGARRAPSAGAAAPLEQHEPDAGWANPGAPEAGADARTSPPGQDDHEAGARRT